MLPTLDPIKNVNDKFYKKLDLTILQGHLGMENEWMVA